MVRKTVEISGTENCPCGSGKIYGLCCSKKEFKYTKDVKGKIYKSHKMNKETLERMKSSYRNFESIFGRNPKNHDLVFIDQYFYSDEDYDDSFMEALKAADIAPSVVYAKRKTGRIVTENNITKIPDVELAEWDAAIDEYYEMFERGEDPFEGNSPFSSETMQVWSELLQDLYATICHFGSFLQKLPRRRVLSEDVFLQYYLVARSLDMLRSIYRILMSRYSDDVLSSIRSLYENFLRIIFLRRYPEKAQDFFAMSGIQAGTHEFAKFKNGKLNRRILIEKETGNKFEGQISNRRMASASEFSIDVNLYDHFYPYLSNFVHLTLDPNLDYYSMDHGFRLHKKDNPFLALQFVSVVNALTLDELSLIDHATKLAKRDLRYMAVRLRNRILELDILSGIDDPWPPLLQLTLDRVKLVGTREPS